MRTVLGAELARRHRRSATSARSTSALRLGWQHEYANTGAADHGGVRRRAVGGFTVYGATPQRDAAVIGFSASTNIAAATQLYLRYDGEHRLGHRQPRPQLGVRLSW